MKKRKILTALAFASLATFTLASCQGIQNEKDGKKILMAEALQSLAQDKIENITIDLVSEGNKDIYAAPDGTADGDGTKEKPYDFVTATTKVSAGTNIKLIAGTYNFKSRIPVGKRDNLATASEIIFNGEPTKFITVQPENKGDRVVFDFSEMAFADSNRGIQVYGDYWYFYGLEIRGAGDNGMYVAGNHNIVDQCMFYNNRDTGLQIGRGGSSQATLDQWPGFNLIRNCTSFANYDDETFGENADGFAAKLTVGHMNVFDGCIAFRNSDDGWDLYAKQDSGNIGTVLLYNCVSFENGFLPYAAQTQYLVSATPERAYDTQNGDGIGFKLGGSTMTGDVIVENCMTFNNKYHGVSDNSNPGFISLRNVTAYDNCVGFDKDGKVTGTRGISYATNKSNNIDLARTIGSYNDFYGVLSYIDNQDNYKAEGDDLYNADMFRGSTAYSIFQTSREKNEVYTAYTSYVDASSYHTESADAPFDGGTEYSGISASDFKDLEAINAISESRDHDDLYQLGKRIDEAYRNADGSVNMHDKLALADNSSLKAYANGNPVGAVLNKTSIAEYTHPEYFSFETANPNMTADMERVLSAYMALNPITNQNATFQDFDITNLINGCEITWESDNTDIITISNDETVSKSMSVESQAHIFVPKEKTTVKLTATIRFATATIKKEFNITVYPRDQYLGEIVSTADDVIRVQIYSTYYAPEVYPIDASSINNNRYDETLYDLTYKYEFAADGNSKSHEVDDVYTSVPGLYKITATATSKSDANQKSEYTFKVYIVDPDCSIDFIGQKSDVILSADGFAISGNLSNVEGYVKAFTSTTDLGDLTPEEIVNHSDLQVYKVSTDKIVAQFEANNNATTDVAYYIYYTVVNDNATNLDRTTAYKAQVNTKLIKDENEFMKLARTGAPDSNDYSNSLTIFYIDKDLDFKDISWNVSVSTSDKFSGLFNGNGHKISNISYEGKPAVADALNVFYKVVNGSIMNVTFDNIKFKCLDSSNGKRMGVIGQMKGGFIQNVHITNSSFVGYESVGGLVGQMTGGDNFIRQCSLINPQEFFTPTTDTVFSTDKTYYTYGYDDKNNTYNYVDVDLSAKDSMYKAGDAIVQGEKDDEKIYELPHNYTISSKNKYQAGLVGNAQIADNATYLNLEMANCLVRATIGDGSDTGGNTGGILGRCKNDSDQYYIELHHNFYEGYIISKGLYGAGILGDLDNGLGRIIVHHNMALVNYVYKGQLIDVDFFYAMAIEAAMNGNPDILAELQKYAHKNLNPIIGRATSSNNKLYEGTKNNIGNWTEYYSKLVSSVSIYFNMSSFDEETQSSYIYEINARTFSSMLGFDLENIWIFDNETKTINLR